MLSKLEVRNRQGALLILPFHDIESGLFIEEILGLDPTKATLVSSSIPGQDGAQHQSSKRESRNMQIKLGIEADYVDTSVRSLRQRLYSFLMPKSEVSLRFYDHLGPYFDIQGVVETFAAPLFTREPTATITLLCFDPDFIDPNPFTASGLTVTGSSVAMTEVLYLGSVDSGIVFTLDLDRNATYATIVHQAPNGDTHQLEFAENLLAGDQLKISTIAGSKSATLKRNNVVSSILWGVSPLSKWIELGPGPGSNLIRVSSSDAGIPWKIEYVNRYGGL